MERVLLLLAEYQWWIYAFFGLALLFYLRRAVVARRESLRSIFRLEQEQLRGRYGRSVGLAAFLLLLMAALFGLTNFLLPGVNRPAQSTPTVTAGPLVAPTLTLTPLPATVTPTASPTAVRPTRPVRPTDTPAVVVADTPVVRPAACPDPNVRIISPGINQVVQGNFPVRGTANIANLQYYKVEAGPGRAPRDHEWTVIGQLHYEPVTGGVLETFNSAAYAPGTYTLRLVVVDQTGNYPDPCQVTISVQR